LKEFSGSLFSFYGFFRHGQIVASHPKKVIFVTFSLAMLASLGMINFHWESNAIKLWIPSNSDFARNYEYLWSKYPPDLRFHSVIFVAPGEGNILEPKYIQQVNYYSNVAEEEIAKQFPTERREMIFCAIHMTEKWPHMMTEKRPFWHYTATEDNIFFSDGNQIFLFYNFNTATNGAH
jgi:hypothetical protein